MPEEEVEEAINASKVLSLLADIANTTKHGRLRHFEAGLH